MYSVAMTYELGQEVGNPVGNGRLVRTGQVSASFPLGAREE